jgi:hypothetical protein
MVLDSINLQREFKQVLSETKTIRVKWNNRLMRKERKQEEEENSLAGEGGRRVRVK